MQETSAMRDRMITSPLLHQRASCVIMFSAHCVLRFLGGVLLQEKQCL